MKTETPKRRFESWHLLPTEILIFIFAFLPKKDFLKAREVCRQWQDVSLTSQFWTRRTFVISGQKAKEGLHISRYLEKFGLFFKHLTVTISTPLVSQDMFFRTTLISKSTQRRVIAEVQEVLQSAGSELRSFHLRHFSLHYRSFTIAENWKETILTALYGVLERQKTLSVVGFTSPSLSVEDGCELLRVLATLSEKNQLTDPATAMQSLTIRDFFAIRDISKLPVPEILEALGRFKTLQNIELSFRYLRSDVLASLTSGCPRLKLIVLYVDIFYDMWVYPSPADWQAQVQKNPQLAVAVRANFVLLEHLRLYLSPAVPLVSLSLDMSYYTSEPSNDGVRMAMRSINLHCLTTFILKVHKRNRPSPAVLVDLVLACPCLTHLSLQMKLAPRTLRQLAAAAQTRTTSHATPGTATLQLHIGGCNSVLGAGVLEGLRAINPFCTVHICDGPMCEPAQHRPAFI